MRGMNDKNSRNNPPVSGRDSFEFGVVEFNYNPGPDAQDRLRRLFTLLVKHATRGWPAAPEKDSPSDTPPAGDHAEPGP